MGFLLLDHRRCLTHSSESSRLFPLSLSLTIQDTETSDTQIHSCSATRYINTETSDTLANAGCTAPHLQDTQIHGTRLQDTQLA